MLMVQGGDISLSVAWRQVLNIAENSGPLHDHANLRDLDN